MAFKTLRTLVNRAGETFDALKTQIIFAEDMNDIKESIEYLHDNFSIPRITSATSYTTDTGTALDLSVSDMLVITEQAGALLFNNPIGSPVEGQELIIRIKDNATPQALTYDTQFRASSDLALPTTTILSKTLYMKFKFNSTDITWDLLAFLNNF